MQTILLSAGDVSGDRHAADFAASYQRAHPGVRMVGLGGDAMREAGVELVADQRNLAVGGLFELAGALGGLRRAWRAMGAALEREHPDLVVLVDSAGFNLPLARRIRRLGIPILYYVAPQVWAWRPRRIRKLAARVDRMAVIFPFEPAVYRGSDLRVDFVGHPLIDSIPEVDAADAQSERAAARARCGLGGPGCVRHGAGRVVTLMPGSRRNEIVAHLDVQLETARRLRAEDPSVSFLLATAPSLKGELGEELRASCQRAIDEGLPLRLWGGDARDAIGAADVVLAKPGTVTVECALMGRPLVVMGRAHPLTAWLVRRLIRVPFLAMPNLIAEEAIVPEFLQHEAQPERLAEAVRALMKGPARDRQLAGLARVRAALGPPGAVGRVCRIAEEMLATAGQ